MTDVYSGSPQLNDDPFLVFESELSKHFDFLTSQCGFVRGKPSKIGMCRAIALSSGRLKIEFLYEFGMVLDLSFLADQESGESRAAVTIDEALRARCPDEAGWPYARGLPESWPKSSDLKQADVISGLLENYARIVKTYFVDLLSANSDPYEIVWSLRRTKR